MAGASASHGTVRRFALDSPIDTLAGVADDELRRLVGAALAGAGQTLEVSETLPPETYTSPAFHALEKERIFRKEWLCIGHVSQVARPGDYFTLDLLGEMLVVTRDTEGTVRAMSRICLHRWAPLVNGSGNAKLLSCPFHKWGFGLDGTLLGAPLMDKVDFDPKSCRLPQFRTEIVDGFIYLNFDPDAAPLGPRLAGMSEMLANCGMDTLEVAAELTYDCAFNWKIVVETFMECYHHIAAHPETFERAFPARLSYGEDGREAWTVVHSPARPEMAETATIAGFPPLGPMSEEERREFRLFLVYPWQMLNVLPDRIFWFRIQPEGPARTRLQTYFLVRPEAKLDPRYDELVEAEKKFLDVVNIEDISVNVMQQLGAATPTATAGRLSHLEKAVWQLADYVRDRVR